MSAIWKFRLVAATVLLVGCKKLKVESEVSDASKPEAFQEVSESLDLTALDGSKHYVIEAVTAISSQTFYLNGMAVDETRFITRDASEGMGCRLGNIGHGKPTIEEGMRDDVMYGKPFKDSIRIGLSGGSGADWSTIECEQDPKDPGHLLYSKFKNLTQHHFRILEPV